MERQIRQPTYDKDPQLACSIDQEFKGPEAKAEHSNFLKGIKWSPDGLAYLTVADDNWARVLTTPPELLTEDPSSSIPLPASSPILRTNVGELVYDYCWYSQATAADTPSWCFFTTSRAHPIHVWDALTGELRCSYRCYDAVDELTAAYSIAVEPAGTRLFAGHRSAIFIFDINRPGRDYSVLQTRQRDGEGQSGIISCLAFASDSSGLMAGGSYSGTAALYDSRTNETLFVLEGHTGGVTHLEFSADGNYLYTGARQDNAIYCWDARYASGVVYKIERKTSTTNQRIYFDIEPFGRHLATGGEDGFVRIYDLTDGNCTSQFQAAKDTVNGVEYHPNAPVLATSSGQRRFGVDSGDEDSEASDDESSMEVTEDENVLRLWYLNSEVVSLPIEGGDAALPL